MFAATVGAVFGSVQLWPTSVWALAAVELS